jgi:hypothetical protein
MPDPGAIPGVVGIVEIVIEKRARSIEMIDKIVEDAMGF